METTIDGKQFATPRGWEDLSRIMEVYEKLDKNITADVVGQYIQHERIAKEFAEYYELYQKYQQDYQIAEILKGQPSEAMVNKFLMRHSMSESEWLTCYSQVFARQYVMLFFRKMCWKKFLKCLKA